MWGRAARQCGGRSRLERARRVIVRTANRGIVPRILARTTSHLIDEDGMSASKEYERTIAQNPIGCDSIEFEAAGFVLTQQERMVGYWKRLRLWGPQCTIAAEQSSGQLLLVSQVGQCNIRGAAS